MPSQVIVQVPFAHEVQTAGHAPPSIDRASIDRASTGAPPPSRTTHHPSTQTRSLGQPGSQA